MQVIQNVSPRMNMQYITEYNAEWPKRFVQIVEYTKEFLPNSCVLHHIGSTSVPDMPAVDDRNCGLLQVYV